MEEAGGAGGSFEMRGPEASFSDGELYNNYIIEWGCKNTDVDIEAQRSD